MLDECFSMKINAEGELETLPMLLKDYSPNLDRLPLFLMRLGPEVRDMTTVSLPMLHELLGFQVDWTAEGPCFESILRELAYFFRPEPLVSVSSESMPASSEKATSETRTPDSGRRVKLLSKPTLSSAETAARWQIQHVLFPAMRRYLIPHKALMEGDKVVQLANLPDLYRIFERC